MDGWMDGRMAVVSLSFFFTIGNTGEIEGKITMRSLG
jgi:hypothetical protein